MRFWPKMNAIHSVKKARHENSYTSWRLYAPMYTVYFDDPTPTPGDTFRQLVKSAVEREEWRGKIQDYLDEAFANECTVEYHDFKRATSALGQTRTQKILTIMWDVPDASED